MLESGEGSVACSGPDLRRPAARAPPSPLEALAHRAGHVLTARIGQIAEEKHTIVNLVAAGIGAAIVPRWTSRMTAKGVRFVPLAVTTPGGLERLPLAAAWLGDVRDPIRDEVLATLRDRLAAYAKQA